MNKISTIIVDDEPLALDLLRHYLKSDPQIDVVAECLNGRDAIEKINERQPALMFLDIQMPGLTGFEVIQQLQADTMPLVVFITAYDQYALSAFDVHAVDYLLKPLDRKKLTRALDRCKTILGSSLSPASNKGDILAAYNSLTQQADRSVATEGSPTSSSHSENEYKRIVVKDREQISLLEQTDIDWVDAAGDYMCIHAAGETHIMRSTLKSLLAQLNPNIFQRVHRSTIVNLNRIEKVIPCAKGEYLLVLHNEERIKVSRNFKKVIKEMINNL